MPLPLLAPMALGAGRLVLQFVLPWILSELLSRKISGPANVAGGKAASLLSGSPKLASLAGKYVPKVIGLGTGVGGMVAGSILGDMLLGGEEPEQTMPIARTPVFSNDKQTMPIARTPVFSNEMNYEELRKMLETRMGISLDDLTAGGRII